MRYLLIDKIITLKKWDYIECKKVISFEEASLKRPVKTYGNYPRSLIIESLFQSFYSLIHYSSKFENHASILEFENASFTGDVARSYVLDTRCEIISKEEDILNFNATATSNGKTILTLSKCRANLVPLEKYFDLEDRMKFEFEHLSRDAVFL